MEVIREARAHPQKKPHAYAIKSGKENVGLGSSNLQKENAMEEVSRMEVEEVNVGLKRKTRAPLVEVVHNIEFGKRPKLGEEVVAFGKLLATQMGSVVATGQPCQEQ